MHDRAIITSINNDTITVVPLITGACMSCKEGCAKRGHPFAVLNTHGFSLSRGAIVKIGSKPYIEITQGLFSILFPVVCATAVYLAYDSIAQLFHMPSTDAIQALFVLAGFLLSATAVCLVNRFRPHLDKPEITEVVTFSNARGKESL